MKYFKKMIGKKVYLSPRNIDDCEKYVSWMNDFDITNGWGTTRGLINMEIALKTYKENSDDFYRFSIIKMEDDSLIGECMLFDYDQINRAATVGLFIGEKGEWHKGYATDALNLLLSFAFMELNINNVMIAVYSFNEPAINLYKKIGFKLIGSRRCAFYANGQWYDELYMDILKKEYMKE